MKLIFIFFFIFFTSHNLNSENIGGETGYKIPRFVSLKSNNTNLRVGSSTNYPIVLNYNTINFPVEIISEYDDWRKINDIDGNQGWLHKNLIKGERFVIIKNKNQSSSKIFSKPDGNEIGKIGSRNIARIDYCLIDWCKIRLNKYSGWIEKRDLWGVYDEEEINIPIYQSLFDIIWKINLKFKD
jgi:SH3-like domain-containing protein